MAKDDKRAPEVQSTANSELPPPIPADSVPSVERGLLHGVGGQFIAVGGGKKVPVSETD